jgi:phenylacetate-CoA ligase
MVEKIFLSSEERLFDSSRSGTGGKLRKKSDRFSGYYNRAMETMSPREREHYQNHFLRQIIQYAHRRSPGIREKFQAAGIASEDIRTVRDLEKVPITEKASLISLQKKDPPFGGLLTTPHNRLRRIYLSPGPIFVPEGRQSRYWRWETAFYAAGFRRGDIVQVTLSYHLTPGGWMLEEPLHCLGCTVIAAGVGNLDSQVKIMHELGVTGFVGMPSFLLSIGDHAESLGIDLKKDLSLEVSFLSIELLTESMRNSIEKRFGMIARQGYGTAEVGAIAYECIENRGMHIADDLIVEIVDPETGKQLGPGEIGEVVVTLFNKAYSLIRFGTGDLSYYDDSPCPCGRTSARLPRLVGRADHTTKVRGVFIHPSQTDQLISRYPEITKCQVVVDRKDKGDEMTFCIELENEHIDKERLKADLQVAIKDVLKLRGKVEFIPKGSIPEGAKIIDDRRAWR